MSDQMVRLRSHSTAHIVVHQIQLPHYRWPQQWVYWIESNIKLHFTLKRISLISPNLLSHIFHILIDIQNKYVLRVYTRHSSRVKLAPFLCLTIFYRHLYYMASKHVSSLSSPPCSAGLIRHQCYPSTKSKSDSSQHWITNFFFK